MSSRDGSPAQLPQARKPWPGPDRRFRVEIMSDAADIGFPPEKMVVVLVLPDQQSVEWTADAFEAVGGMWVNGWEELDGMGTMTERLNTADLLATLAEALVATGSGPIAVREADEVRLRGAR